LEEKRNQYIVSFLTYSSVFRIFNSFQSEFLSIINDCRPCYKRFKLPDCQTRACLKELTAEKVEPLRVLDIGCGAGVTGKRLKERGIKEVVGVELNKDAYGEAKNTLIRSF
jgi:2-polyprenyl-3-methyl-5-hydroxy-6-metoxy-1,4-benzoquinol methylase